MRKTFLLGLTVISLAACSSTPSAEYSVKLITPTGIPTLAFYDQGNNENWVSYSDATLVAPSFATNEVDAVVFDAISGLKNIIANQRNYVFARLISQGTFYLVSTKHQAGEAFDPSYTVDAFVKTGNAATSFLTLAKDSWNWGDLSSSNNVTWETGLAAVRTNLIANPDSYDYYLVAQPVLFAATNELKAKGITLNVIYDIQAEWVTHKGGIVPAAALFINKTSYQNHKAELDEFLSKTDERVQDVKASPAKAVEELSKLDEAFVQQKFGYKAAVVSALQKEGKNGFGMIGLAPEEAKSSLQSFLTKTGSPLTLPDEVFLG